MRRQQGCVLRRLRSRAGILMKKLVIENSLLVPEIVKLINQGLNVTFTAKGNSMIPFIYGGRDSVLLAKPVAVNVNDVVLAAVGEGKYVLHRVIKIEGDSLVLMGDGNIVGCEYCEEKDVLAVAVAVLRNGRRYECKSREYLFWVKLWRVLLPVRRCILPVLKRINKVN